MVIPIVHIGGLYKFEINIILIILLSTTGVPCPKDLSSDVTPHLKETSMLKINVSFLHIHVCYGSVNLNLLSWVIF